MITINSSEAMQQFGEKIGREVHGGDVIELIGDVGAGKTTLVKGVAKGMGVNDDVQSPSFTINRVYDAADGRVLSHYDFYRLADPGIMATELHETMYRTDTVTFIEWADAVERVLPEDRTTITISSPTETTREMTISAHGPRSQRLVEQLG